MDEESFDEEIANLEKEVSPLRVEHDKLRRKFEAGEVQMARYFSLIDEKKRLEREIAAMKGRPYHDEDDPDGTDYPEPPDETV